MILNFITQEEALLYKYTLDDIQYNNTILSVMSLLCNSSTNLTQA